MNQLERERVCVNSKRDYERERKTIFESGREKDRKIEKGLLGDGAQFLSHKAMLKRSLPASTPYPRRDHIQSLFPPLAEGGRRGGGTVMVLIIADNSIQGKHL